MTVATAPISDSLQMLVDSRLDTIDRMLLGRVSRQDRLAIVREVESQIHELLYDRGSDELTREDVLAVLARLDPPEAYIPDTLEGDLVGVRKSVPTHVQQARVIDNAKMGRTSGILGLSALALILFLPIIYMLGWALKSESVLIFLGVLNLLLMFIVSVVALTLGLVARRSGPWALVGIVTSVLAFFLSFAMVVVGVLLA